MKVPTEASEVCLILNGKIMTVLTEASGNLHTIQWQENDLSDRNTKKPANYSLAR